MIVPKSVRQLPPQMLSPFPEAFIDIYSEQFSEDVECCLKVEFESDDPKEILDVAKYLEKVAVYMKKCQKAAK